MTSNTNNTDYTLSNVSKKFDCGVGVFDTFGGSFKDELAKSCSKAMKSDVCLLETTKKMSLSKHHLCVNCDGDDFPVNIDFK